MALVISRAAHVCSRMTTLRTSERENDCLTDLSRSSSSRSRHATRVGERGVGMFRAHVYAGRVITVFPIVIVAIWARLSGRRPRWAIKQHSVLPGSRHSASCATSRARTGSSPRDGGQRSPTSRAPFAAPARYGRGSSAAEISGIPLTNTAAVSGETSRSCHGQDARSP